MADQKQTALPLSKYAKIDKIRNTIVLTCSIASFIFIFSVISCKSLISKMSYQNRIISAKQSALTQLKTDLVASQQLISSYTAFNSTKQNLLGEPCPNATPDCNNAKIILDALPSQYDYPALVTSVYDILQNNGLSITSISGTDEQLSQSTTPSNTSSPVAMPISFEVIGNITTIKNVMDDFQRSIRPFQFQNIKLTGSDAQLTLDASIQSYYQPGISFQITQRTVK